MLHVVCVFYQLQQHLEASVRGWCIVSCIVCIGTSELQELCKYGLYIAWEAEWLKRILFQHTAGSLSVFHTCEYVLTSALVMLHSGYPFFAPYKTHITSERSHSFFCFLSSNIAGQVKFITLPFCTNWRKQFQIPLNYISPLLGPFTNLFKEFHVIRPGFSRGNIPR